MLSSCSSLWDLDFSILFYFYCWEIFFDSWRLFECSEGGGIISRSSDAKVHPNLILAVLWLLSCSACSLGFFSTYFSLGSFLLSEKMLWLITEDFFDSFWWTYWWLDSLFGGMFSEARIGYFSITTLFSFPETNDFSCSSQFYSSFSTFLTKLDRLDWFMLSTFAWGIIELFLSSTLSLLAPEEMLYCIFSGIFSSSCIFSCSLLSISLLPYFGYISSLNDKVFEMMVRLAFCFFNSFILVKKFNSCSTFLTSLS